MELGKLGEWWQHHYPWVVFNFSTIFFLGLTPQDNLLRKDYSFQKKDSIVQWLRARNWNQTV